MIAAISISKRDGWITVALNGVVKRELIAELQQVWESALANPQCRACIFELSAAQSIDDFTISEMVVGARKLKNQGTKVYFVQANSLIQNKVTNGGLDGLLILKGSADEVLVDAGIKAKSQLSINVDFINPFLKAAVKTIKNHAEIESVPGTPFLKGSGPTLNADIAAVLGITSKAFTGTISICFQKEVFLAIVNKMLNEKYQDIADENADAAAEILNIIAGAAKEELNKKNYGIQQAIPTVVRSGTLKLKHSPQEPTIVLPLNTPQGRYEIHVGIIGKK